MARSPVLRDIEAALVRGETGYVRTCCSELLANEPENAEGFHLLALAYAGESLFPLAIESLHKALALKPGQAGWHRDMAVIHLAQNRAGEALNELETALSLDPLDLEARSLKACALLEGRYYQEGADAYRELIASKGGSTKLYLALAECMFGLKDLDGARDAVNQALQRNPRSTKALEGKARIHERLRQYDAAVDICRKALEIKPGDPQIAAHLATALYLSGDLAGAVDSFRLAAADKQMAQNCGSTYLNTTLHDSASNAGSLLRDHIQWAQTLKAEEKKPQFQRGAWPGRRLRIGYISGEHWPSPTSFFIRPVLKNHNKQEFQIYFYWFSPGNLSFPFENLVERSIDMQNMSPQERAEQIRADEIDVLVDISGHLGPDVMQLYAEKLAPVQVHFPSYPCTTGLSNMDYIMTDTWTCPPGMERQYSEAPYLLEQGYLVYDAPVWMPQVASLPALREGQVTFGLLQRPAKLTAPVWDAVAEILNRLPDSKLLIHFGSNEVEVPGSRIQTRLLSELATRGVTAERIRFQGFLKSKHSMELISREIDIALDSFPYNGQTTTCACLYNGIPVVTLEGEHHVARVSAGILRRAGLDDWVAGSAAEYVEIAVRKAQDLSALARLRAGLRQTLETSSLMDGRSAALAYEEAYRWMFQRYLYETWNC
jgi:predicted O-linked N-acetylglucosamine transferase (SPINDLY family)